MSSFIALTRDVSPSIVDCELTHLERVPIDPGLARAQHAAYERALEGMGCDVRRIAAAPDMPDSVFIEDTAVVLDEVAIVTRPGAESRLAEVAGIADALAPFRRLVRIEAPGTLDGGDVLVAGRSIFIGISSRSNEAAVSQVRAAVSRHGYSVTGVTVTGCLHLKSAITEAGEGVLLMNRAWVPAAPFDAFDIIDIDPREEYAANVVRLGDRFLYPTAFPHTLKRLRNRGLDVTTVDVSELAKAEGAVTCCSLIFRADL